MLEERGQDLVGKQFGELTVIRKENEYWLCLCSCGALVKAKGFQLKNGWIRSCGCLKSRLEKQVTEELCKNNIKHMKQYTFPDLMSDKNYPLPFDIAIFNEPNGLLCLIECQGVQHYVDGDYGKQQRNTTDRKKRDYCARNRIPLYEIAYDDDISKRVKEIISYL